MNDYLQDLGDSSIRSLADITIFNNEHPDLCFVPGTHHVDNSPPLDSKADMFTDSPDQSKLIGMQNYNTAPEFLAKAIPDIRKAAGPDNIDHVLKKYGLDVIVAPTDSQITTVASLASA